jgi:hypothetical protein
MSGTITINAIELAEAVLGAVAENSLRLRDIDVNVDFGVPDGVVWLVRNLYISTGTIYISGEVVVCG